MKNIHVIPTDKPSRLIKQTNGKLRLSDIVFRGQVASGVTQNIYITSDEEIKEGDWCLDLRDNSVFKIKLSLNQGGCGIIFKIILTTDQDLIKDGVQAIDDEFLEWFVKNPSCESVEVKSEILYQHKETYRTYPSECNNLTKTKVNYYLSTIPKEEPKQELPGVGGQIFEIVLDEKWFPKQETLEEAAENYWLNDNTMTDNDRISYVNGFTEGYKLSQERSYSEEDMKEAFDKGFYTAYGCKSELDRKN